jgi:L-amino acid N-acyltransferase YncA
MATKVAIPGRHPIPGRPDMMSIRIASLADLPRLVEIYNQAIVSHTATADTVLFSVETRRSWFDTHSPGSHPIYVCEVDGIAAGYLSISPYRDRPGLRRTGEVSYYVDYNLHGRGIGSALMEHALQDIPRTGIKVLVAILLDWNTASIRLLEKFGFERWGHLPNVAELDGKLCGQYYYGRNV